MKTDITKINIIRDSDTIKCDTCLKFIPNCNFSYKDL